MNKIFTLLFLIAIVVSCQETTNQEKPAEIEKKELREGITIINGVERSELALTMRDMYNQMKLVHDSLKAGKEIQTDYLSRYKSIHTDVATEPEKVDEVYSGMASNFLSTYENFEAATDNKPATFNLMLDACLACHQQKCPGPIKAINRLKLNNG